MKFASCKQPFMDCYVLFWFPCLFQCRCLLALHGRSQNIGLKKHKVIETFYRNSVVLKGITFKMQNKVNFNTLVQ